MFTKIDFEEEAEGMVEYAQAAAMDSQAVCSAIWDYVDYHGGRMTDE